jgi:hypothetical protein
MTRWMHAKETKSRTYMQWSAEPAEASMEPKDQPVMGRSTLASTNFNSSCRWSPGNVRFAV